MSYIAGLGCLRSLLRSGVGDAVRTTTVAASIACSCGRYDMREVRYVAAAVVSGSLYFRNPKTRKMVVVCTLMQLSPR